MTLTRHGDSPGNRPLCTSGTNPARTSDDFPLPGRAGDHDEATVEHPSSELRDQPFPTDEHVDVGRCIRRQPPVRLPAQPRLARQLVTTGAGPDQPGDLLDDRLVGHVGGGEGAGRGHRGPVQPVTGDLLGPRRGLAAGDTGSPGGDRNDGGHGARIVDAVERPRAGRGRRRAARRA